MKYLIFLLALSGCANIPQPVDPYQARAENSLLNTIPSMERT